MACNCCNIVPRKSYPGYTYITNNVAQSVIANGLVNPGSVARTSCTGNIAVVNNNSLVVRCQGTYMISVELTGTPTQPSGGSGTSGTIQPTISVNGLALSSPSVPVTTTIYDTQFVVRTVTPLKSGDVITISNLGTFTLTLAEANQLGGQNVNILIERYN